MAQSQHEWQQTTFNMYNTPGYSPNGNTVMWPYDNFSSGSLNTSKWTAYKEGSNNSTVMYRMGIWCCQTLVTHRL
jgi:hypothetical protein